MIRHTGSGCLATFSSRTEIGLPGFFLSYSVPPLASAVLYASRGVDFYGEHEERRIAAVRSAITLFQSGEHSLVQVALDSTIEYVYERAWLRAADVKVACHAAAVPGGTVGTSLSIMLFIFSTCASGAHERAI